jgi:RNA polymerase sigma factor (sigma-70 family)
VLSSPERQNADPAAAAGAGEAFLADLDRRYRVPLIRYFAKRIRETYDVDDLVQEVFIRLVRQAAIESVQQIESYVFQTAANVIRDRARRQAARHYRDHDDLSASDLPTDDLSPERVFLGAEQLERVIAALEELPESTRQVFVLRRYEGMRHEEIAAHLGMSVSGVRFHMEKAKAHLVRRLEEAQ